MKDKSKEKAEKTFNRQPERFQWNSSMSEEHIFPEELEMINRLRVHFGDRAKDLSDKMLMYFLLARREEVEDTIPVLENYLKVLETYEWMGKRLTLEDAHSLKTGWLRFFTGIYDKHDRMLNYMFFELNRPKEATLKDSYAALVYETQYTCENTPLRYLRNGGVQAVSMKNVGLKNFDTSKGKELGKALTGTFPRRVRRAVSVDGGTIMKVIFKLAKAILPRKLVKRFEMGDYETLKEFIPKHALLEQYGGECKLTLEDFIKQCQDYDKKYASIPMNQLAEQLENTNLD
eukprot:TRINITY_DN911_c0_g1_i1.p1 TRINITY_DN911_c0_g1~~TRINITY_DN911_c0_g1_i1.p1  ORF type:complete len:324 (-),score=91.74 TRINITY_DN911_c0_g1_i1:76-942(-)